jgi:hypothetical protein
MLAGYLKRISNMKSSQGTVVDHDMDVRSAADSYKESQIGGKFDSRAHSMKPSYV